MHFHFMAEVLLHARLFLLSFLKINKTGVTASAVPDQHHADIWICKRDLVYPSPHPIFATFWLIERGQNQSPIASERF